MSSAPCWGTPAIDAAIYYPPYTHQLQLSFPRTDGTGADGARSEGGRNLRAPRSPAAVDDENFSALALGAGAHARRGGGGVPHAQVFSPPGAWEVALSKRPVPQKKSRPTPSRRKIRLKPTTHPNLGEHCPGRGPGPARPSNPRPPAPASSSNVPGASAAMSALRVARGRLSTSARGFMARLAGDVSEAPTTRPPHRPRTPSPAKSSSSLRSEKAFASGIQPSTAHALSPSSLPSVQAELIEQPIISPCPPCRRCARSRPRYGRPIHSRASRPPALALVFWGPGRGGPGGRSRRRPFCGIYRGGGVWVLGLLLAPWCGGAADCTQDGVQMVWRGCPRAPMYVVSRQDVKLARLAARDGRWGAVACACRAMA